MDRVHGTAKIGGQDVELYLEVVVKTPAYLVDDTWCTRAIATVWDGEKHPVSIPITLYVEGVDQSEQFHDLETGNDGKCSVEVALPKPRRPNEGFFVSFAINGTAIEAGEVAQTETKEEKHTPIPPIQPTDIEYVAHRDVPNKGWFTVDFTVVRKERTFRKNDGTLVPSVESDRDSLVSQTSPIPNTLLRVSTSSGKIFSEQTDSSGRVVIKVPILSARQLNITAVCGHVVRKLILVNLPSRVASPTA